MDELSEVQVFFCEEGSTQTKKLNFNQIAFGIWKSLMSHIMKNMVLRILMKPWHNLRSQQNRRKSK